MRWQQQNCISNYTYIYFIQKIAFCQEDRRIFNDLPILIVKICENLIFIYPNIVCI